MRIRQEVTMAWTCAVSGDRGEGGDGFVALMTLFFKSNMTFPMRKKF